MYIYRLLLIKEIVSLMYLISVYDPFFDTHLKQCEYWYVFVLNRLSFLFSTAKGEELDEGTISCMDRYILCVYSVTSIILTSFIQNLDYPDCQKIHYYACAEGVTNDLLIWVWLHIE